MEREKKSEQKFRRKTEKEINVAERERERGVLTERKEEGGYGSGNSYLPEEERKKKNKNK